MYAKNDEIPATYFERVKRIRAGYAHWYEFPTKSEKEIKDLIVNEFQCSVVRAYEDIQIIKIILGDVKNPGKEFIRFQVNAMFDKAYQIAERDEDSKAMTMAAAAKAKFNMLHLPDAEPLPYDEIVPQPFEPTDDPTPLGLKKDPDIREKKRKMLEKYIQDIEIIDVPYEEMVKDGNDGEEEDIL